MTANRSLVRSEREQQAPLLGIWSKLHGEGDKPFHEHGMDLFDVFDVLSATADVRALDISFGDHVDPRRLRAVDHADNLCRIQVLIVVSKPIFQGLRFHEGRFVHPQRLTFFQHDSGHQPGDHFLAFALIWQRQETTELGVVSVIFTA